MGSHKGVDMAWQRLTAAEAKQAGMEFVIGYVSEDNTGKNITTPEITAYRAAGIGVLLVYEYSTSAYTGGASRGARDASIAVAQARQLGYPTGCVIAFAIDEDVSRNPSVIKGYCDSFDIVLANNGYGSMVYGGIDTVKYCLDNRLVNYGWQTYAWSQGKWDNRAIIRQVSNGVIIAGKNVDLDIALVDNYGAWMPEGESWMATTDADWLWPRVEAITHLEDTIRTGPEAGKPVELTTAVKKLVASTGATLTDAQFQALLAALPGALAEALRHVTVTVGVS